MHTELQIIVGVPSSTSLGYASVTDDVPEALDLLQAGLSILDENGESGWIPKVANIKNGGVWIDSATSDGRILNAGFDANVIESMRLVITGTTLQRSMALSNLMRFSRLCREFWSTDYSSQPVYLKWHAQGANNPQYALLYDIGVETSIDFLVSPDNGIITLTLEREPAWRAIAPGDNPQRYAKEKAGLVPSPVAGAGRYTYTDLNLLTGTGLLTQSINKFDEVRTSNVNYVDIDADDIPGDAPCLTMVSVKNPVASSISVQYTVARSTSKDLFPADNTTIATGRARNTLNAGDATIGSGGGLTTTKTTPAGDDGLISNGSAVTRYVGTLTFAAGVVSNVQALRWSRVLQQLPQKYLAFLRVKATGTPTTVSFKLSAVTLGETFVTTGNSVTLPSNAFQTLYMGVLDLTNTGNRQVYFDGRGLDTASQVEISIIANKTGADTSVVTVADLILMPYDEAIMGFQGAVFDDSIGVVDTTGFISTAKKAVDAGRFSNTVKPGYSPFFSPVQWSGTGIYLKPKVKNRLYFLITGSSDINATETFSVNVNIVPRWYGVRDD